MKAWLQCELWKASNIILLPFFSKFQLYQSLRTVHRILALRENIKASPTSLVRSQGAERRSVSNARASFRWLQLGQKQNSYICFPHLHWFIYKMKIITLAFYGSRLLRLKFTDYSWKVFEILGMKGSSHLFKQSFPKVTDLAAAPVPMDVACALHCHSMLCQESGSPHNTTSPTDQATRPRRVALPTTPPPAVSPYRPGTLQQLADSLCLKAWSLHEWPVLDSHTWAWWTY